MKKCKSCQWSSDKCKNPNSKNKDKFIEDITECAPMLIDETIGIKGCKYCAPKTSNFEILICDEEEGCKWCDKEKCDSGYDENECYGLAYSIVPLNYCPNCGRDLRSTN